MSTILDHCRDQPRARFEAGEMLIGEGERADRLYVLIDGQVEIRKADHVIAVIGEAGAVFGEIAALLGVPHMATVRALAPCTAYAIDDGGAFLAGHPEATRQVARMLAQRLHEVTRYLVQQTQRFENQQIHLDMVGEVLETLMHLQYQQAPPGLDVPPDMAP